MFGINKKKIKIITHSGFFHSDDVFACAALLLLLDDKEVEIIRTRDEDVIKSGKYVVDVGGIYDPSKNRFDHHQLNGAGERANGVSYASFGLVWQKFGAKLCGSQEIAERIDEKLAQSIDAIDNGIQISKSLIKGVYAYDIGSIISSFIPTWKEGKEDIDTIFLRVIDLAKEILQREIKKAQDKEEAKEFVIKAYEDSEDKRIVVLNRYYPWHGVLKDFEEPLFVITPRNDGKWNVVTVRDSEETFESRKDLPINWAGKMNSELAEITGVPDAIFCHRNLFIAVAHTKEGAITLAKKALQN